MKKPWQVALIGAGNLSDSAVARMPGLADHLGPIKSYSLRVASRIANTLRAGYPVADCGSFEACSTVLIAVPDEKTHTVIEELGECAFSWRGKAIVVCSNVLGCRILAGLEDLGALAGSLAVVAGFEEFWFLLEGNRALQRHVTPLLAARGVRVTAIEAEGKAGYAEALALVSAEGLPLLRRAAEGFRNAGIPHVEAGMILEKQISRGLRSYLRSGKVGGR